VVEDRPVDGRCDLNAGSNHFGAPLIGTPVPISLGHESLESCRGERCQPDPACLLEHAGEGGRGRGPSCRWEV